MTEKIPPQLPSVEKSLIGSMLITPSMIEFVLERIEPAAFYDPTNRAIYETIRELFDEEKEVDIVSITELCTGVPGVDLRASECTSEVDTVTKPGNLIELINNAYARRYAITLANHIISKSFNQEIDLGQIATATESLSDQMERFCSKAGVKKRRRGKLVSVNEHRKDIEEFFFNGIEKQGIAFSEWPKTAKSFRLVKGTLNVIGGIPSHGKTTFTDALIINSISEHGWKWAVFSPENKPYYLHIQPLSEKLIGKPFFNHGAMSQNELSMSLDTLNSHLKFLEPDDENASHEAIFRLIKDATKEHVDGILIDPWNKLDITTRRNENKTDAIGRYIREYQAISRKHMIWLGIVAHPTKMYKMPNEKRYQVPTLYDIEGSAHWFNGIDIGVTFYRYFETNHCELHIQKMKFKNHGKIDKVLYRYNDFNTRLYEITKDQIEQNAQPKPKNEKFDPTMWDVPETENQPWQNKI